MASGSEPPSASEAPQSAEPAPVVDPAPVSDSKRLADSAVTASRIGTTVGHILLEARLGVGGMGEVYRGFDRKLERRVAVKMIRTRHRLSAEMKARFLREARLLSKLEHPGICQVYDLLEGDDTDFLILEFVDGETLYDRLKRGLGDEQKLLLAEKVARVLAVAHEQKIVHRDLKPDNIMVMPDGGIKVLDFGIARTVSERQKSALHDTDEAPGAMTGIETQAQQAVQLPAEVADEAHGEIADDGPTEFVTGPRIDDSETAMLADNTMLTQDGLVVGTARYMSPEQARGRKVEEASDMYSFGIMLQEMLTDQRAYAKAPIMEMLLKVSRADTLPLPDNLDPDLVRLIEDLKSLDAQRRPNAQEAAERLRWILDKPQRLRRKKMLIACVSGAFLVLLALLIVVTVMAVRATHAREEAERRRGQAEGLISFMLGDLYDKLEGVGRTDILDDVGDRSMTYFESVPDEDLTDEERFRRVEALNKIGNVRWAQGDLPAALDAFQQAETVARKLVERDAQQTEWQAELGAARFWIGFIHFEQNDLDTATRQFQQYLETSRHLVHSEPDNPAWQMELAYSHSNLAAVWKARGEPQAALEAYQQALEIKQSIASEAPDDLQHQREVAISLNLVGNVLEQLGRLPEALEHFRSDLEIYQRVANAEPENSVVQERLGVCHHYLGNLLMITGHAEGALEHLQADLAVIRDFAQQDPTNKQWQRDLAASRNTLGLALLRLGRSGEALDFIRQAEESLETLVSQDPTNSDWTENLARSRLLAAIALQRRDRADEALREVESGLEHLGTRGAATESLVTQLLRIESQLLRGSLLRQLGSRDEATTIWAECARQLEPLAQNSNDHAVLRLWAATLLHLERKELAQQVVDRLLSFGYREPLLLELAREHGISLPRGT